MLPDIEADDRSAFDAGYGLAHQRAVLVRGRADGKLAVRTFDEPRPAGAETGRASFGEGFLERVEGAERFVDRRGELTGGSLRAAGGDDFPEERVVHVAARVVADRRADVLRHGAEVLDQLLGAFRVEIGLAGDRVVQVGDVRLMMLRVVDFHRLRVDVRFESVVGVSEFRESSGHDIDRFGLVLALRPDWADKQRGYPTTKASKHFPARINPDQIIRLPATPRKP